MQQQGHRSCKISDISYVFLREAQHKYSEFRNIKYMTLNVNNLDLGKKVDIIIDMIGGVICVVIYQYTIKIKKQMELL